MPKGFLKKPEFGPRPAPSVSRSYKGKRRFEYEPILNMVRDHPGRWAKIAEFKGGRKITLNQVRAARQKCRNYLNKNHYLEDWSLSVRLTGDTNKPSIQISSKLFRLTIKSVSGS